MEKIDYHGCRKLIPAFHCVEGGAVVPVDLMADHQHLLRIRLLSCCKPLMLSVTMADGQNRFLDELRFRIKDQREFFFKTVRT